MKYSDQNRPLVCMMKQSTCYKSTYTFQPKGVLWHCTGANNPNLWRYVQPSDNDPKREELLKILGKNVYGSDWNHQYVSAGVNAWIGKAANGEVMAVQALPWNYAPWGCGGAANGTHIQFEMCEDALMDGVYFDKCYREGVELTAYLCKMYNIDPKGYIWLNGRKVPTILCHYDAYNLGVGTGHYDVYNWFNCYNKTMDDVRADVVTAMQESPQIKSAPVNDLGLYYSGHCQTFGNLPQVHDGQWCGTKGKAKRLEALWINPPEGVAFDVEVHLQGIGWKPPVRLVHGNDILLGSTGECRRLEAVRINVVRNDIGKELRMQGHVQTYGDTAIVGEGMECGTTGAAKRLEAIRLWME